MPRPFLIVKGNLQRRRFYLAVDGWMDSNNEYILIPKKKLKNLFEALPIYSEELDNGVCEIANLEDNDKNRKLLKICLKHHIGDEFVNFLGIEENFDIDFDELRCFFVESYRIYTNEMK